MKTMYVIYDSDKRTMFYSWLTFKIRCKLTFAMLTHLGTDICALFGDECGENAECVVKSNVEYKCVCHYGYAMHYKECLKDKTGMFFRIPSFLTRWKTQCPS